jgi:cell division protein FtsW (lipid II flippase)
MEILSLLSPHLNLVTGLGILLVVMSLGYLLNRKRTTKIYEEEAKSAFAFYMNSLFTLIFGVFILAVNVPVDWKTWIVQVFGWFAILKGVYVFITPERAVKSLKKPKDTWVIFVSIFNLILGIVLLL